MKPYISTDSQRESANSRALSPVPFAADPKDAPSMRYTGFFIGISCIKSKLSVRWFFPKASTRLIKQMPELPSIEEGIQMSQDN